MLLRNFDNIMIFEKLCKLDNKINNSGYGDGFLGVKTWSGTLLNVGYTLPFKSFSAQNNSVYVYGYPKLLCGYDEAEVTYDDYKIASLPSLNFVSHSVSPITYDSETNTYTTEYTKTYNNATSNTVTINCIGCATGSNSSTGDNTEYHALYYKEKLPQEIEIPAGASITLKLKTTVTGNPNKPTDYVATASVE